MKHLKIHIGMPRTATTAIQNFLTRFPPRSIWYPPQFKDEEGFGHHQLTDMIADDPVGTAAMLVREFCAHDSVLLSAEAIFAQLAHDTSSHFRNNFTQFTEELARQGATDLDVICVTRPLDQVLWGIYLQNIRNGVYIENYPRYLQGGIVGVHRAYDYLLNESNLFGATFLHYDQNIIERFLAHLHAETDIAPPAVHQQELLSKTPSLSLHAYFLWLLDCGAKPMDTADRWSLVGMDLGGEVFDAPEARFRSIGMKTYGRLIGVQLGELKRHHDGRKAALDVFGLEATTEPCSMVDLRTPFSRVSLMPDLDKRLVRAGLDNRIVSSLREYCVHVDYQMARAIR